MTTNQRYVSDELTHFVGARLSTAEERYALLLDIFGAGLLKAPGLSDEALEQTPDGPRKTMRYTITIGHDESLSSNRKYAASIVCFADIPVEDLPLHIRKYSEFGLAFSKRFLVAQGANPVFYIAASSSTNVRNPLANDPRNDEIVKSLARQNNNRGYAAHYTRGELFDVAERIQSELLPLYPKWDPGARASVPAHLTPSHDLLREFLASYLFAYMKFFDPDLADDHPDNYYMEREWRVIVPVTFSPTDVTRILIPQAFAARLRVDLPAYTGQVTFTA